MQGGRAGDGRESLEPQAQQDHEAKLDRNRRQKRAGRSGGGGVLDRGGVDGDFARHADAQFAALDLDFRQIGLVQDFGQLANQGGVDFGVFLVIGHWSCALSFVVFDKRDGAQPRSRTWVRAAWTASS